MKKKKQIVEIVAGTLLLPCLMVLSSCNNEESLDMSSPPVSAYVEGVYNAPITRAVNNRKLESFSMYCFDEYSQYTGTVEANNILYTMDSNTKIWSGNYPFYMSDWFTMYAYAVSPNSEITTTPVFTNAEQSFIYEAPNDKGSLLKVASKYEFTKEGTNNKLALTFNDALYTLFFQAFSGFQNVDVEVKSITLHNVPNKAKFTFSPTQESRGTWAVTEDNQYVNCSQELATAAPITTTSFTDIQNEPFVLFPIQPTAWDYYGLNGPAETFAQAKENNHCYIEVKMRIIQTNEQGKKFYLWGYADNDPQGREPYESAFYPYLQYYCTASWQMMLNGYYYVFLDDNGVDKEGLKITPHPETGGATQFKVSSQIDFRTLMNQQGSTADAWEVDGGKTVVM